MTRAIRVRGCWAAALLGILVFGSSWSLADEENGSALKYHAALQKRPEPGYLFDRFYNAWLDQSTAESLQNFLQKQIERSDTTANRLLLAFFHSKQNNDQAAVDELSKALKADPHNAALWYHRAQAESRMLDFDSAIADLRRAAKSKPDDKQSLAIERGLGTLLARNRQTTEAIAVWKAILTAHPDDEDLCEDIIELHIEEGLYPQAAELLESLIARTKDPYAAVTRRLRLGDVHQRAGRRQKAVELYSSALRESGENSWLEREILAQIEQSFRAEDDLVGLKKQYAKLIETYPKRIVLRQRQCRLLADLGQSDEAIRGYRDILERTPGDRANREEFVEMLCRAGRLKKAVQELETLCQQNPKDAELRVRLAKLWNQAKNPSKAVEAARQYLDLSDHSEYAYLRAARLVESFGDRSSAAKFYQTMADAFRDSPSAQEAFAAFLYADGQKDQALTIWKSLAAKADLNQTLNIARALDARNEDETALEILTSREKQFGDDPLFLGQRVGIALRLKQYESCLPWARRRVELAKTSAELEAAVVPFLTACQQADRLDPTIRELKAIHPRPIALSCLLAELLETAGDSPQADPLLQAPAEQGEPLAVAEQIRLFTARGQWAEAAAATRRLLELSGGRQSPLVRRLVELYERNGQFDEAMKWVETWKRLSPGATTPWLIEARLLQMQGKAPELALDSLRKAIQRFPDDEELRTRLAQTYQDLGKPRDAEQVYWQLYEKASDLSDKLRWVSELAQSAQREGTTPRLIELFRQRSQNNRPSIVPWMAMAEIYRVVDDSQNRRQALLAAAKLKPDDLQLLTQIARLEELEGDWKSAVATLERAVALDKTTQTRQKIATLHLSFGNRDTGLAMMRDLLGEQIADPRVVERLADSLCGMQEWDRAVELLRPRLAEHPGDYRLRYLLGVAYEESGKTSEALDQFVTLLDRQEELPNLKKKPSSNAAANLGYLDLLGRLLPAEAVEWFRLSEGRHMAYGHRQPGMAQAMSRGGTGVVSTIFQPPSVDAVRSYAMSHVLTLATGLDDSQTAALTVALKSHGVRDPKVLLKLGVNLQGGMPNVTEALDENPNNEALLAMAVFTRFDPSGSNREDDMVRAFKKFRKSRPELAVMAAMQAESLLDDGLTLAATLQRPNPFVVMAIAQSLGGGPWGNQRRAFTLDPKHRNAIVRQLVAWYPQMSKDQNSPFGPWAFYLVANAVRAAGNAEAYFTLLDNEVTQWRKNPSQQASRQAVMVFGRSNTPLLAPLKFPPDQLSDFPPNVLTMLSRSQDNPFQPPSPDEETTDWTPKKIVPLLQKIQDPTLRVLLAQNDEASQLVESELKAMLAQKPPRLDAYLLAAGKASTDSRYGDAIGLLEKARHLPMKPEMRRQVDAAIVSAAMAAKDANDKNRQEWLKIGGDAALRLRRQRLDPAQREQLASALDDLGLKDEAKKLEKQLVAASSSPSFSPSPYAAPMTPTNQERLEKMVAAGNRQSAVRLLVSELRSLVMQVAANPGNRSWLRLQAREVKKRMNHLGLTDEVMQQFTPDQDASPAHLNECATVLAMFNRTSEARTLYERVLAKRPKDDAARVALLLMSTQSDSRSADVDKHLSQLSDVGSNQLGQSLNEGVTDMESPLDERFRLVELAIRLLTVSKERPQINAPWAMALVQSFGRRLYWNNQSNQQTLPSLYEREKTNDSSREVTVELLRRRQKLHDDLCLRMIDVPDLSRAGFRYLLAASEASDKPWSDDEAKQFRQRAEKILLDESQPKLRSPQFGVTAYYGNQNSPNEVRPREPEDFLVAQAWRSNDWRSIDEVLLPKLAGGRGAPIRKKITRLMQLYRCPADEFLTLATQVAKEPATAMPGMTPNDNGLETVVDVWADRKLSAVDLEPMIFEAMRRNPTSPYQPMQTTFPSRYLTTLADRGETKKAEAVLEHLTTVYLGPAEKRAEFVQKNFHMNQITPGTANAKIYMFGQILSQLAQDDSLVFLVFAQIESTPQLGEQYGFCYRPQQIVQQNLQKQPDRVVAMLEASPWTADVERFRVLSTGPNAGNWPLVQVLRNLGNQQTSPVWTALAEKQKSGPTFGRGLLLALRDQQNNHAALLQYLDQTIDAIQKLPNSRQNDLAVLLKTLLSDSLRDESTAPTPAGQWLRRQTADRSSRALEKLRSAKRFEELGIANCDPWQVSQYLAGVLPEVIDEDPKAARTIFFRVVAMAEDAQRRTGANYYAGNDETFADSALNFVFQQQNRFRPKTLVFLIDLFESREGSQLTPPNQLSYWIGNFARRQIQPSPTGKRTKKSSSAEERFQQFYETLGRTLDGRSSLLLIPGLLEVARQQSGDSLQLQQWVDWTDQQARRGSYPSLAADLHACLQMEQVRRNAAGRKKPDHAKTPASAATTDRPTMADYHKYFQKLLGRTDAPASVRLATAAAVAKIESGRLPLALARDIAQLYVTTLETDAAAGGFQQSALVQTLSSIRDDETGRALVARWREQFARRYLRPNVSNVRGRRSSGNLSSSDLLNEALTLYLSVGDVDRAMMLLNKYDSSLPQSFSTLACLVRFGQCDRAARLFREHWKTFQLNQSGNDLLGRYDSQIAKNTPAFAAKLSNRDERLVAEIWLAAMPDAEAASARDKRLTALAAQVKDAPLATREAKIKAFQGLLVSKQAVALLADDLAAEYKKLHPAQWIKDNDFQELEASQPLLEAYISVRLAAGDVQPLVDLLTTSSNDGNNHGRMLVQLNKPPLTAYYEILRNGKTRWTVPQSEKVAVTLRNMIAANPKTVYLCNRQRLASLILALHVHTGQADEMIRWYAKVAPLAKQVLASLDPSTTVFQLVKNLHGPASADDLDRRIGYVSDILKVSLKTGWFPWSSRRRNYSLTGDQTNVFDRVVQSNLVEPTDLIARGPAMVRALDDSGLAKAALAAWMQSNGKSGEAAALWRDAIAAAAKDSPSADYWRWDLAQSLHAAGKADEAARVADDIHPGRLAPRDRKPCNAFREMIHQSAPQHQ